MPPECNNFLMDGVYINGYGWHGVESNNFTTNNYTRDNFVIKNVELVTKPSNYGVYRAVTIDDTSSGVTTYGVNSRLENIQVAGYKLFQLTDCGATAFVSRQVSSGLTIADTYSNVRTVTEAPSTGTHYVTDMLINVLGFTSAAEYGYRCVRSGTFEARSATGASFENGKTYFDSANSTLIIGDVVEIGAGSDPVNNTVKRWTIIHIDGVRHYVDRIIYGTLTGVTINTVPPAFEVMLKS